jgi:hypothetical protein
MVVLREMRGVPVALLVAASDEDSVISVLTERCDGERGGVNECSTELDRDQEVTKDTV